MPWNRTRPEVLPDDFTNASGEGRSIAFEWRFSHSGANWALRILLEQEIDDLLQSEDLWQRLMCHRLTDLLPSRGLSELLQSLRDMFEFYLPPPPSSVKQLPVAVSVELEMGETTERPVFPVSEE